MPSAKRSSKHVPLKCVELPFLSMADVKAYLVHE